MSEVSQPSQEEVQAQEYAQRVMDESTGVVASLQSLADDMEAQGASPMALLVGCIRAAAMVGATNRMPAEVFAKICGETYSNVYPVVVRAEEQAAKERQ